MTFLLSLFLFSQPVYAMKPAPFQPVTHTDANTQLVLTSNPESQLTELHTAKGERLWSMKEYVGRRMIFLSPDGNTLILFGNLYFGGILLDSESAVVLSVYEKGKPSKELNFSQVFGMTVAEAKIKFDVPVMSGGWLAFLKYVDFEGIDWKTRSFSMKFQDNQSRALSF